MGPIERSLALYHNPLLYRSPNLYLLISKKIGKYLLVLADFCNCKTLPAIYDMSHFVCFIFFVICLTSFGVIFLPVAKWILRLRRSGILFAHTTAAGNITRRSRISLRSNRTRVRRIELKKHLRMQVFFLVGEDGFGPSKLKSNRFTVCPLWPLGNSPILS